LRAPWLTQGYYKEPEKGAELWENGWLHTGDVASISPDGVLEIKDRIKDVIKTGGEWISSLERPYAIVVVKERASIDQSSIALHLQQYVDSGKIDKWAIPENIAVVAEIPKTSVGKINKKLIREHIR